MSDQTAGRRTLGRDAVPGMAGVVSRRPVVRRPPIHAGGAAGRAPGGQVQAARPLEKHRTEGRANENRSGFGMNPKPVPECF